MTVNEIFMDLSAHMIKGMMVHDQMADYYDFLSLRGYKRCHEYHYKHESCNYRKLHRYYLNHYNMLIDEAQIDSPEAIPESWYKYRRQDVDPGTKKTAVKSGIMKWVDWEKETKQLFCKAHRELLELHQENAALFVECFIKDVDCELKWAERKLIELSDVEYSLDYILQEQKSLHDKYKKKMKKG